MDKLIRTIAHPSEDGAVMTGLVPVREFPRLSPGIGLRDGLYLLMHRLGLSTARTLAAMRDRHPVYFLNQVPKEQLNYYKLCRKCFLSFDLVFHDILHTDEDELRHVGMGRRYLLNRLLRTVLAGLCDSLDASGRAGDFPAYSGLPEDQAAKVRGVQETCLRFMKEDPDGARLLQSLKVRIRRVATPVLKDLAKHAGSLRTEVRKGASEGLYGGMRRFSDLLVEIKGKFTYSVNKDELYKRKAARKKEKSKHDRLYYVLTNGIYDRRIYKWGRRHGRNKAASILKKGLTDLRRFLDPSIPNWYRRPSDGDWEEGLRHERRKLRGPTLANRLPQYGMGNLPGLTEPLDGSNWKDVRTDWTAQEARERYGLSSFPADWETYRQTACRVSTFY